MNIGQSIVVNGELNASEDLTIDGRVDGTIRLTEHVLTIGPHARIKAEVFAKSVVVLGEVKGNITASDKVSLQENGSVEGDITAPRVGIHEGAHFRGSIDMKTGGAKPSQPQPPASSRPAPPPTAPARA